MRSKKANDAEKRIYEYIQESGLIAVQVSIIGEDPGSRAIRSIAVYKVPSQGKYVDTYGVMDIYDYHKSKNRAARANGMQKESILWQSSREEAVRFMNDRAVQLRLDYTWFIPGTEELVPGCWGYEG